MRMQLPMLCAAQRKSKNRASGDAYALGVMTAVRVYHTMMTAQVFPAVCSASERADRVNVQPDGALAHTGKDMLRRLNEFGATMSP